MNIPHSKLNEIESLLSYVPSLDSIENKFESCRFDDSFFFFVVCPMTRSHINNVEIFVEFCNYVLAELSHTFCMSSKLI